MDHPSRRNQFRTAGAAGLKLLAGSPLASTAAEARPRFFEFTAKAMPMGANMTAISS